MRSASPARTLPWRSRRSRATSVTRFQHRRSRRICWRPQWPRDTQHSTAAGRAIKFKGAGVQPMVRAGAPAAKGLIPGETATDGVGDESAPLKGAGQLPPSMGAGESFSTAAAGRGAYHTSRGARCVGRLSYRPTAAASSRSQAVYWRPAGAPAMAEIEDNVDRELFRNVEKLRQLRIEHRDLDEVIARLSLDLHIDELQLKRLKKRKLMLKDQIARLESQLIPDLNA